MHAVILPYTEPREKEKKVICSWFYVMLLIMRETAMNKSLPTLVCFFLLSLINFIVCGFSFLLCYWFFFFIVKSYFTHDFWSWIDGSSHRIKCHHYLGQDSRYDGIRGSTFQEASSRPTQGFGDCSQSEWKREEGSWGRGAAWESPASTRATAHVVPVHSAKDW